MKWPALIIAGLTLLIGCSANSDQILSIFFDGVFPDKKLEEQKAGIIAAQRKNVLALQLVKHDPYEGRECKECHSITNGAANQLKMPIPKLCWQCHDKEDFQGEVVHSPVEDGECMECHNPHESKEKNLLRKPVVSTCLGCHDSEDIEEINEKHSEIVSGHEENKPTELCSKCHNPHASEEESLLREGVE